jgi:hypothetical protein
MLYIVGAYMQDTINDPLKASLDDLAIVAERLHVSIECYDPDYDDDIIIDGIKYIDEEFSMDTVKNGDIIISFCHLDTSNVKTSVLYLELGWKWKQGLPVMLIVNLYSANICTIFDFDWKVIKWNCELALSFPYGRCYIDTQRKISGDLSQLYNVLQMITLFKFMEDNNIESVIDIDKNGTFEQVCDVWKNADKSVLHLYIYSINSD